MNNSFINNDCYMFSELRGKDLQELLLEVSNYYLEYRSKLDLPRRVTFGAEIEYEDVSKSIVDTFVKENLSRNWISKWDGSIIYGGEVTSPVMTDSKKCWNELQAICKFLDSHGANTSSKAGGHIHVGANVLNNNVESWKIFLKVYAIYEHVINRFSYGDKQNGRPNIKKYAADISNRIVSNIAYINRLSSYQEIHSVLPHQRYCSVNFSNVCFNNKDITRLIDTIEFRSPNATTNEIIWQNNINAFTKLLLACDSDTINMDFLDYKLSKIDNNYYEQYMYDNIDLLGVLEFVDLIFDNNIDKIYFLRQYFKDFKDSYGIKSTIRTKKFAK